MGKDMALCVFQIMLLAPGLFSHLSWPVGHDAATKLVLP